MAVDPLRIAIATNGRFHVLDLARELAALGHDVRFYSAVPGRRLAAFGFDPVQARTLLPAYAPIAGWDRWAKRRWPGLRERMGAALLNRAITARLAPCDVFIGMSGLVLEAAQVARSRYGALIYLERGSKHILAQREILARQGAEGPSDFIVARELAGYAMADRIVIPAAHVRDSFARETSAAAKLFVNPYGVDLQLFPQRDELPDGPPTVLFVGGWLYRKGVDLLVQAMRAIPEARLMHVGGHGDAPFPDDPRFVRTGPVDQRRLGALYRHADVLVLPSREEGLALVQLQALASGLPVICSDQTGGRDLRFTPGLSSRIDEVRNEDVSALISAIRARLAQRNAIAPLADEDRALLSWRAYGERYARQIAEDLAARRSAT